MRRDEQAAGLATPGTAKIKNQHFNTSTTEEKLQRNQLLAVLLIHLDAARADARNAGEKL